MSENGKRRRSRQLTPEEKWEVFLEVTSQEISQADAARKYGVDVSVIIRLRALAKDAALAAFASAKPGRPATVQDIELDELRQRASGRVEQLHEAGVTEARLYGHDPTDGVGGDGAFFLLLDEPEVYGLPPDPVVTTRDLPSMWRRVGVAAGGLLAGAAVSFLSARGQR